MRECNGKANGKKRTREKVREHKLKGMEKQNRRNCHSLTVIYSLSFIFKTKGKKKKLYCLSYFYPFRFYRDKKKQVERESSVKRRFEPKRQQNVHKM